MSQKPIRMRAVVVIFILMLVIGLIAGSVRAAPAIISRVTISNVTDVSFVVSWVTDTPSNGSVTWGTNNPPSPGTTVTDSAGSTTTHYVTITGLSPSTLYYFQVSSVGHVDNTVYQVTTGPTLGLPPVGTTIYGFVYQSNGTTPVPNAIVYLQIQDDNGLDSLGVSQLMSGRADSNGVWSCNLGSVRTNTFGAYFSYTIADNLRLIGQGGGQGTMGLDPTPYIISIPGTNPYQHHIVLNQAPTAVTLASFSGASHPGMVELEWVTGNEVGLLGFNLYRSDTPGGVKDKLNTSLIPATTPGELSGNTYEYVDETVVAGETYYYWIELVKQGENQESGPVSVLAPYGIFLPMVRH